MSIHCISCVLASEVSETKYLKTRLAAEAKSLRLGSEIASISLLIFSIKKVSG